MIDLICEAAVFIVQRIDFMSPLLLEMNRAIVDKNQDKYSLGAEIWSESSGPYSCLVCLSLGTKS